jgi:hypothetical protein
MNNVYYFLISLISYLGVITGFILMLVAPEEKKPGMKYFNFINHLLFFCLIILLVYLGNMSIYLIGLGVLGVILFLFIKKYQIYIAYLFFSFILYLFSEKFVEIFAVIIFAFGLSAGAYMIDLKNKKQSFYRVILLIYFVVFTNLLKIIL